uniref:restriction endonuclease subunit S n=1 Tax=Prevotella sp. TaxID=59823 RepID=UPI0027E2F6D5
NSYYEKLLATGEVKCIDEEVPFEVPTSWSWARLTHITYLIEDCPHSTAKDEGKGYPLVRTPNVGFGHLLLNDVHRVSEKVYNQRNTRAVPQKNDLIFAREAPAGNIAVINEEKVCLGQRTVLLRPITHCILPQYLAYYILAPSSQQNLIEKSSGTTVAHVNLSDFRSYMIAVPPIEEQNRIVNKVMDLLPLIEKYSSFDVELARINDEIRNRLKKSVLQEAIQGRLIPQIEEEGIAQELLEQINAEKQRLVKEGKLKKSALKDSVIFKGDDNKYYELVGSEVSEIELPFYFPSTWSIARLNAVCQLTDGLKTIGKQCLLDAKYLRGKSSETIVGQGKLVYKGDNIMLVDGENSGEVFIVPQDGYMGSTFKQLWISSSMYEPYVLAFIQFYKETLRNSKKGAAIPHLNKELFFGLIIGIPPLQEQRRIVQEIEQLMQLLK